MLAQPSGETISLEQANGCLVSQLEASNVERSSAVGSFEVLDVVIGEELEDLPETERMTITLEDGKSRTLANLGWDSKD